MPDDALAFLMSFPPSPPHPTLRTTSSSDLHATMHCGTIDPFTELLYPVNLITSALLRNHHLYPSRTAIWSSTT